MPQQITQCRQGCRIDIGGRSKPRRRTDGPVKHPSRNLHCAAGVRTAQRAAEHNLVRLADRLMNGDAMRKPRMPWVQELTQNRPMGVLECCCTTPSDHTAAWAICRPPITPSSAPGIATERIAARNRGLRGPAPLPHRAVQAQMTNRLYSSLDDKRGAGQGYSLQNP